MTCSGKYLDFDSYQSLKYKRGVIYNLLDRAVLLSDDRFVHDNLNFIRDTLSKNSYTKKFLDT